MPTLPEPAPSRPASGARGLAVALCVLAVLAGCNTVKVNKPFGAVAAPEAAPAPPLEQVWRINAEAGFGPDAPLVTDDGRMIVGTRDGKVFVFDAASGEGAGKGEVGEAIEGPIAVSGPMMYIPLTKERGGLLAYNAVTASRAWAVREGSFMAGPLVMGAMIVAATNDGTVLGIDRLDGAVAWRQRPDTTAQIRATPLAMGALAIVADTEGTVRAYDPVSGDIAWTADAGAPIYRTPATDGETLVVPTTRGRVAAFGARGERLWRAQGAPLARWGTPSIADGLAVAGATDGTVTAWDVQTGEQQWTTSYDGGVGAAPLVSGGMVYVGTYRRELIALDAASGAELWRDELRGRISAGLASADGTVVVLAEPYYIYGFRPAGVATR